MTVPSEADLQGIGARAINDTTLQISLVKSTNHFLTLTSLPVLRPLLRREVERLDREWATVDNLISNGPFVLSPQSILERRVTLHRNPVWPDPLTGNVEIVNISYFRDLNTAFSLWQDAQLDLIPWIEREETEQIRQRTGQRVVLKPEQAVFYVGFNFDSGVFREVQVRRALSAAIDRDQLIESLVNSEAFPLRHLTPPGAVAALPLDEIGVGYDPAYARQQMADSGFRDCRLMPPVTLLISSSDLALRQAELLRDMWADELGCKQDQFVIEQAQFGTLLANTRVEAGARRPDMWILGWQAQFPDAHNWLGEVLHCQDSENRFKRPCAPVDDLLRRADDDPNTQRLELYREAESLFFAVDGIQPVAPLYIRGQYFLRQVWVDFKPASFLGEQFDAYMIDAELKQFEQER